VPSLCHRHHDSFLGYFIRQASHHLSNNLFIIMHEASITKDSSIVHPVSHTFLEYFGVGMSLNPNGVACQGPLHQQSRPNITNEELLAIIMEVLRITNELNKEQ
jgi:hypothetical protein